MYKLTFLSTASFGLQLALLPVTPVASSDETLSLFSGPSMSFFSFLDVFVVLGFGLCKYPRTSGAGFMVDFVLSSWELVEDSALKQKIISIDLLKVLIRPLSHYADLKVT